MRFGNIVAPFVHLCLATKFALLPTLRSIYATPTLLLSPKKLSRIFFANAWVAFSNGMDENSHEIKRNLLAPASGVVMDIGAGLGHDIAYMDLEKVKVFVAVEPNEYMHKELRAKAAARGFFESPKDGERRLVIISHGAEELDSIKRMLEVSGVTTVDTIISFLTFCSVPNSTTVLPSLIKATLRPGGTLIYFEHVRSHRPDVAFWQRAWSPIWSIGFDGCQLDIPSDIIIHGMKADDGEEFWKERKAWGLPDEDIENIWWHQLGQYTRL